MNCSTLDHASAYVAFQHLAEVNCGYCDSGDRWNYYTLEVGSVHDVPAVVVETIKRDPTSILIARRTLPLCEFPWIVLAERPATFDEAATLM